MNKTEPMNDILILLTCLVLFTPLVSPATELCTNSYLKDKDVVGIAIDAKKVSAHQLLTQFIECGLKSVKANGWQEISKLSFREIREQLTRVDAIYVDEIPQKLLPSDQRGRESAGFHQLPSGQWQILIVPDDFQLRFKGEQYLLLFHELISTIDPSLDASFAATIDYEFKALQANTTQLQSAKIDRFVMPKRRTAASAFGTISSGGGDLSQIWVKRQLRNYLFDFYLTPQMQGKPLMDSALLEQAFSVISFCPMDLTRETGIPDFKEVKSAQGLPMLLIHRDYFHRTYNEYLKTHQDPDGAQKKVLMTASVKNVVDFLLSRATAWDQQCNP